MLLARAQAARLPARSLGAAAQRCAAGRQAGPRLAATAAASTSSSSPSGRPTPRAARPTPLRLIYIAKADAAADAYAAAWAAKVRRYAPLEEVCLKPNPGRSAEPAAAVRAEGDRVLKALGPADVVVALDERGREATSEGLADLLAEAGGGGGGSGALEVRGPPGSALVFLIGGPHGHDPRVRARAALTLRLSGCVLNHAVARCVLLEQLYRGWTILRGEPYHH